LKQSSKARSLSAPQAYLCFIFTQWTLADFQKGQRRHDKIVFENSNERYKTTARVPYSLSTTISLNPNFVSHFPQIETRVQIFGAYGPPKPKKVPRLVGQTWLFELIEQRFQKHINKTIILEKYREKCQI